MYQYGGFLIRHNMKNDNKRELRLEKKLMKRAGTKRKRQFLKKTLENPEEAHLVSEDFDYKKFSADNYKDTHLSQDL